MGNELELSHRREEGLDDATSPVSRERFASLIVENERLLYSVCRSMTGSHADSLDLIQDTVLAAWQSIGSLREPRYFRTWLTRILMNRCHAHLRHRRAQPLPLEREPVADPQDEAVAIRQAVEALPLKLRPVVILHYYEDFGVEEVARVLGVAPGTVKSRLSRARALLRQSLSDKEDSDEH